MHWTTHRAVSLLVMAQAFCLATVSSGQETKAGAKGIPAARLLPAPTTSFVRIRAKTFWEMNAHKLLKTRRLDDQLTFWAYLQDTAAPQALLDIEQVVLATVPLADEAPPATLVIVQTQKPVDEKHFLAGFQKQLGKLAKEYALPGEPIETPVVQRKMESGQPYYDATEFGLAFLGPQQFLAGTPQAIQLALRSRMAKRAPPAQWQAAMERAEPIAGCYNPADIGKMNESLKVDGVGPLPEGMAVSFGLNVGKRVQLSVTLSADKPPNLAAVLSTIRDIAALELNENPETIGVSSLLDAVKSELVEAAVPPETLFHWLQQAERTWKVDYVRLDGKKLAAQVSVAGDAETFMTAGCEGATMAGDFISDIIGGLSINLFGDPKDERPAMVAELQRIGKGLDAYHEKNGHYPPPAIYAKDGAPLLSWRVALLPYIGEADLYKQFHLDEPWDSEHNFAVWKRATQDASELYNAGETGQTRLRLFTGKNAPLDSRSGAKKGSVENPNETMLVVQARRAVGWTRPESLRLLDNHPFPRLGAPSVETEEPIYVIHALLANGQVKTIKVNLDRKAEVKKVEKMSRR